MTKATNKHKKKEINEKKVHLYPNLQRDLVFGPA